MRSLVFIICFVLVLTACKESYTPPPAGINAQVAFFNASGYSQLRVVLDGKTLASGMNFGDLISYGTVISPTVDVTLKLTAPGLSVEKAIPLDNDTYTSFFINESNSINVLTVLDRSSVPVAGNMMIRFINLSPDAPQVNFFLGKDQIVTEQSFKQFTDFKERFAGIYDVEVRRASDNALLLSADDVSMPAGDYYTIALVGNVTTTSDLPDALNLQLINP